MKLRGIKRTNSSPSQSNRKNSFLVFLLIGFVTATLVHIGYSCSDSFNFDREEEKIDEAGIKKGAHTIEAAFISADTIVLAEVLTAPSLEIYKKQFGDIQPYMAQFGDAFKKRKLLYANPIFAVFEIKDDSGVYTVEMTVDDEGNWKLVSF
jgi:hypothetical protein